MMEQEEFKKLAKEKRSKARQVMKNKDYKKCALIIHSASAVCLAAGSIPVPVIDSIPITGTQVGMVLSLGNVFNQKFSKTAAKALISSTFTSFIGRNLSKILPVAGWIISGAIAASLTEALGWSLAYDFATGAKNDWIQMHAEDQVEEDKNEVISNEQDEMQRLIMGLHERAVPFLENKGRKKECREEYNALIHDFESVLDYLEKDNPLRKVYDDLC